MDYISHGLWSYIFFHWIKRPLLAVCFGLLPDTLSWGVYGIYRFIAYGGFGKPILDQIPEWTFALYNITHSLVVVAAVILLVLVLLRRVPVYIFAWPIAIVMDLLTHTTTFLPTPFLWPLTDWKFAGISWATPWMLVLNASLIVAAMIIIYRRKKRKARGNP